MNLLGMPCEIDSLLDICRNNKIWLMEDNCESMGATNNGRQCGTIGDIGTFSTFFSHHICTVEGGVTVTNDEELYHLMLSIRSHGWTRHLPDENTLCEKTGVPFYDSFNFIVPGYNLRNNDIFASIGLSQLDKLDDIVHRRQSNARYLLEQFANKSNIAGCKIIQQQSSEIKSSWFGFAFDCFLHQTHRDKIVDHLNLRGIETRPIVAGNFCKNPVIKHMNHRIVGDLPKATRINDHGFFIGNNGETLNKHIDYLIETLEEFEDINFKSI